MSYMYGIIAAVGWTWTAIALVFWMVWMIGETSLRRGFEVVERDEKQS